MSLAAVGVLLGVAVVTVSWLGVDESELDGEPEEVAG